MMIEFALTALGSSFATALVFMGLFYGKLIRQGEAIIKHAELLKTICEDMKALQERAQPVCPLHPKLQTDLALVKQKCGVDQ